MSPNIPNLWLCSVPLLWMAVSRQRRSGGHAGQQGQHALPAGLLSGKSSNISESPPEGAQPSEEMPLAANGNGKPSPPPKHFPYSSG